MKKHALNVLQIGIAELDIAESGELLRTSGLGSCVGVVIYETKQDIAGMAHVMLPDSALAKSTELNEAKYADTAVQALVKQLLKKGAHAHRLRAKLAGGAQMFQFSSKNELMRIGPRNVEAVKQALEKFNIVITAADVGGGNGRTIEFNPETRKLKIRTVHQGETEI